MNTILVLKGGIGEDKIRINVDKIEYYSAIGDYTEIKVGNDTITVALTVEQLDQVLIESYMMVKHV